MLQGDALAQQVTASEGSTAGPVLRSIDEISQLDEESLREIQDPVNRASASKGGNR